MSSVTKKHKINFRKNGYNVREKGYNGSKNHCYFLFIRPV